MVFNIHLKEHGEDGCLIRELLRLAEKYNAYDSVYFAGSPSELEWMERIAPQIQRTAIQFPEDSIGILEMAQKYHCTRVQFFYGMYDEELIQRLHENGILCNLFFADDAEGYEKNFSMGIDTILTNRMDLAAEYKSGKM